MRISASLLTLAVSIGFSPLWLAAAEPAPDYVEQIAPLLNKYCAGCHNAVDREGGLSLESFADLQRGGENGPAVLPEQAASSRLVRVLTGAAEPAMPPEDSEAPTADEIALLTAWIDAGAKGPEGAEVRMTTLRTPKIVPRHDLARGITALAYSPDGGTLAVARFALVELIDTASGKTIQSLDDFPGKVNAVHFSTDGKRLVTASGVTGLHGLATLWDVTTGERLQDFSAHRDTLYDAELSPDQTILGTCSYDQKIILWDVAEGRQLRTLEGHNDAVYDLAFSPDGTVLASASGDETAKLWQVSTGLRLDTLGQPQAEQYVVAFSPDGRFVLAGGADNRIRVWRLLSKEKQRINPLIHARFAHEGPITALEFSPDGRWLVSAAADRSLKLWDARSYTQRRLFESQPDEVAALVAAPHQPAFTVGRLDGTLAEYPLEVVRSDRTSVRTSDQTSNAPAAAVPMDEGPPPAHVAETEPNDRPTEAQSIELPAVVQGVIEPTSSGNGDDADLFRFESQAGQQWMIEVNAARKKSPLDSKVEVLDAKGQPVLRVLLRAVRDSYFTFRGQNSDTSDGFRLHNWEEMELNEFLYAGGEVTRLWHYPRGPDSGFMLYPGRGNRDTFFDTTPVAHPLHEPCYIVEPITPGSATISNGLPVFPIYFENDDDSLRELGADSRLSFTAPADGEYLVRITDARGYGGSDFKYELTVRPRRPDFTIRIDGANPTVNAGSGKEFRVTAQRIDGFGGEVEIAVEGLPPGFHVTQPLTIEAGQESALGVLWADADAPHPTADNSKAAQLTATAMIHGQAVSKPAGSFGEIKLGEAPKLRIVITPDGDPSERSSDSSLDGTDGPVELVIAPGETISAKVRVVRNGFKGLVDFGKADAGRNLPHGVYVDDIGLNGLLVLADKDERTFFLTAAKWVPETTRLFHLQTNAAGGQASLPVVIRVEPR